MIRHIKYTALGLLIFIIFIGIAFFNYQSKKNLYSQSFPYFGSMIKLIDHSQLYYGKVPNTKEFVEFVKKNDPPVGRYLIDAKINLRFDTTENFIFLYGYGYDNDDDNGENVLFEEDVTFFKSFISDGDVMICGKKVKSGYAANLEEDLLFDFDGRKIDKTKMDSTELRDSKDLLLIPYYNDVYNLNLKQINYFPPYTFVATLEIRLNDRGTYNYKWYLTDKELDSNKLNYDILEKNVSLLKQRKAKVLFLRVRIAEGKESFDGSYIEPKL